MQGVFKTGKTLSLFLQQHEDLKQCKAMHCNLYESKRREMFGKEIISFPIF